MMGFSSWDDVGIDDNTYVEPKVIINEKNYKSGFSKAEYINYYTCRHCNHDKIEAHYKFCNMCGSRIIWEG